MTSKISCNFKTFQFKMMIQKCLILIYFIFVTTREVYIKYNRAGALEIQTQKGLYRAVSVSVFAALVFSTAVIHSRVICLFSSGH